MTLGMVLQRLQTLRPHEYPENELREWLAELEKMIDTEILSPRMEPGSYMYEPITAQTDYDREMLVEDPYGQVYLLYLMTQMDLHRGESDRYAFDAALFNTAYLQYAHAVSRRYLPRSDGRVTA